MTGQEHSSRGKKQKLKARGEKKKNTSIGLELNMHKGKGWVSKDKRKDRE